jgi:hypothetical protein
MYYLPPLLTLLPYPPVLGAVLILRRWSVHNHVLSSVQLLTKHPVIVCIKCQLWILVSIFLLLFSDVFTVFTTIIN